MIAQTNGIQIGYYNRENILRIFKLIDNVTHQPGVRRKRLISVNFIIKQLFDIFRNRIQVYSYQKIKEDVKLLQSVVGSNL